MSTYHDPTLYVMMEPILTPLIKKSNPDIEHLVTALRAEINLVGIN